MPLKQNGHPELVLGLATESMDHGEGWVGKSSKERLNLNPLKLKLVLIYFLFKAAGFG